MDRVLNDPRVREASALAGRYLIVDNAPAVRQALIMAIRSIRPRAQFVEASTGKECLDAAAKAAFDAIFTGMRLTDGEPALPCILQLMDAEPGRPVLLCTVMPQNHPEVIEALSSGAAAYLPKPVSMADIRMALERIDERTGRRRRIL